MVISQEELKKIFLNKIDRTNQLSPDLPLRYQISEFDCGPTTVLNGISYLFERHQISPELIRNIMLYTLDTYREGVMGKAGTSHAAMLFLSHWINGFAASTNFPIAAKYYRGRDVYIGEGSYLQDALRRGGAIVARLFLDEWHYVLLTGIYKHQIYLFDPYYQEKNYKEDDVILTLDYPTLFNRVIDKDRLNQDKLDLYCFGDYKLREAVVLFNEERQLTSEKTIEYFI